MTASPKRNTTARPYALTEHGTTMLASIRRSQTAVKRSIEVVRAFVALKKCAL